MEEFKMIDALLIKNNEGGYTSYKVVYNSRSYSLKRNRFIKEFNLATLDNRNNIEIKEPVRGVITQIYFNNNLIYIIPEAKAPYNFVPLNKNKKFIEPELVPKNVYLNEDNGFFTGYIELNVTNKTPVYVRGTIDLTRKETTTYNTPKGLVRIDNYKPADKLALPGSSVRGMVRSLVEIVSFGKFGFFNDETLYYRSFADDCLSLRDDYNEQIGENADIKSGLIFKEGKHYRIIPDGTFTKIPLEQEVNIPFVKIKPRFYHIYSGRIDGKLHDWEIECDENKTLAMYIPESDIKKYKNDKNRQKKTIDLIEETKISEFVPCFYYSYIENGIKHFIIGHTRFFRVPYDNSIADCVQPNELVTDFPIDLTNSMFGTNEFPSKLFFEDLEKIDGDECEIAVSKILGSPKPTSFQLYLEQSADLKISELDHYNSYNAKIRGNKLYWHKTNSNYWKETGNQMELINKVKNGTDKQRTIIKPIKEGATFRGRIRFENLSKIELGALLFVLKLKNRLCHKIGMGKPYGLGTIKIEPNLYLSDRKKRYSTLGEEWNNLRLDNNRISSLVNEFSDEVMNLVSPENIGKDLWLHPRLGQLRRLLDWKNKPSDVTTEYMSLKEFKLRMVLPIPKEICNNL
jgi:CRISPR/Cas system CSM-associated protein Csm3 (group 7 of RAMP superfamily)